MGEVAMALQKAGGKDFENDVKELAAKHGSLQANAGMFLFCFLFNRMHFDACHADFLTFYPTSTRVINTFCLFITTK